MMEFMRVRSPSTFAQGCLLALVALQLSGCMVRDAYRQLAEFETGCYLSGELLAGDSSALPGPYVVAVIDAEAVQGDGRIEPYDIFVLEHPGQWAFALMPGRYRIAAIASESGLGQHQADDPVIFWRNGDALDCRSGDRLGSLELDFSVSRIERGAWQFEFERQRSGVLSDQTVSLLSLGQATAFGQVSTLDHARFNLEVGRDSLWRPLDFLRAGHAGVYFLDAYDPDRTPVLFVHGINGSPRVFEALIAELDLDRFQPWVYYYPSGIGLNENSDYLTHIMLELELRLGLSEYHVIAHSMGGLVARGFLQRRQQRAASASIGHFIALSSPWGGHTAATRAVESSPLVLPVWKDMAVGSAFLDQLFEQPALDEVTRKHLLFSFAGGDGLNIGTSDGVITLASLLRPEAQDSAATIHGFDTTHIGILSYPPAVERVLSLLSP
jgi:pimeloyl-ACP methyl ester carboxylesterase